MGCGGSKEEVASGNTVATRKKPTDNTTTTTTAAAATVVAEKTEIENKPEKTETGLKPEKTDMKDIIAVSTEGKLIGRDSPDRYFSSRKDEVALEAEVGSGGYRTPLAEEHGTPRAGGSSKDVGKGKDKVVEAAAAAEETKKEEEEEKKENGGAMEGTGLVEGEKSAVAVNVEQNGNGDEKSKNSTDLKEPTLAAEETKVGTIVAEKTSTGESEITGNVALPK